jgi:hypothetical protein
MREDGEVLVAPLVDVLRHACSTALGDDWTAWKGGQTEDEFCRILWRNWQLQCVMHSGGRSIVNQLDLKLQLTHKLY